VSTNSSSQFGDASAICPELNREVTTSASHFEFTIVANQTELVPGSDPLNEAGSMKQPVCPVAERLGMDRLLERPVFAVLDQQQEVLFVAHVEAPSEA